MPRFNSFAGASARAWMNGAGSSTYVVGATPASISVTGTYDGGTKTTASVTVAQTAGDVSTIASVSWARVSGSASISANSPTSATTTFTGTPPGENQNVAAVMRATVTNNLGQVATVDVNVTVAAGLANLAVSVSPSFGSSASAPTGSPYSFGVSASSSNGSGPFTYSWAPSGRISPTNTSSATYTAPSNVPGTEFCLFTCTITDAVGRVGQQNGSVNITWF